MTISLITTVIEDGITCEHKTYGLVATIKYCGGIWYLESDNLQNVCGYFRNQEFASLAAAEYAALIIVHELEATGH